MTNDSSTGAGIYDDFPGYRVPSEEELNDALVSALVVVDANLLLNLYRYNDSTSKDLIELLRHIGDRLWVPSQVMREFWRNRIGVLANRGVGLKDSLDTLSKQQRATGDVIERWAKATATRTDEVKSLLDKVTVLYSVLEKEIRARNPAPQALSDGTAEPILHQLEKLLRGKVDKKPTQADFEAAVREVAPGRSDGSRRVIAMQMIRRNLIYPKEELATTLCDSGNF